MKKVMAVLMFIGWGLIVLGCFGGFFQWDHLRVFGVWGAGLILAMPGFICGVVQT